jgi:hypothetical protein
MGHDSIVIAVGIGVGVLQALIIFILAGIKDDINDIWKRMYAHYHEIKCDNRDCTVRKTGDVIVPHESA